MHILALGLNHRTAPLTLREQAAFAPESLGTAAQELATVANVDEAAILSTCNRTEIYCGLSPVEPDRILHWLARRSRLSHSDLQHCAYHFPDARAVRHTFRVAAGLDSMVLGEPQILGQMKAAFSAAHQAGTTGKILNRLFQNTFAVAKRVRTDTAIGVSAVSVAYAAVDLARRLFADLGQRTALLVGAGETIELVARHLKSRGIGHIIIANRSVDRAERLAGQTDAEAIALAALPARLTQADIVVSSTASTLPILGKGAVERALKARRHRPMFLVDLAVPRDIEPEVAELRDAYLYTVDDIEQVVTQNRASRQEAAGQAEKIIDLEVVRFMRWMRSLDTVPTIRGIRAHAEALRQQELDRARARLARGDDPDAVLQWFSNALTNKLTHTPTDALRRADANASSGLLRAARKLFNLS